MTCTPLFSSLPSGVYFIYLFYYENRTQGTLKTIKKNKEQSTTG